MVQVTAMIRCRNASKNVIKEVDVQASAVIAKNPNIIDDALPTCLIDIIQKFDATIYSATIEKMREVDPKPWSEWAKDDIPRFLGMMEMGERDLGPTGIMRRNDGVIIEHNIRVASLDDSEGCESASVSSSM